MEMCSCVFFDICPPKFLYFLSLPFHQFFLTFLYFRPVYSFLTSLLFLSFFSPSSFSLSLSLEVIDRRTKSEQKRKIMKCNSMKRMVRRASDIRVVCFFFLSGVKKKKKQRAKGTKRYRTNGKGKRDRKRLFLRRKITTTRNLQRRFQCKTLIEKPRQPCCSLFSFTHPTTSHLFSLLK